MDSSIELFVMTKMHMRKLGKLENIALHNLAFLSYHEGIVVPLKLYVFFDHLANGIYGWSVGPQELLGLWTVSTSHHDRPKMDGRSLWHA